MISPEMLKENFGIIRASTDDQKLSIEFQKSSLLERAREMGEVLREENIFIDAGISGFSTTYEQRPGMAELMKRVNNGEVNIVFAYKRCRLSRRAREYLYLAGMIDKQGTKLIFTDKTEVPFSTQYGWIIECTLAGLLQREVENIRDKVVLGLKTLHKDGRWPGGKPPFGLYYDSKEKVIRSNNDEIVVVQELFNRLAEGDDLARICASFRENDYLGPSKSWTVGMIHKIGRNPLYMGVVDRFNEKVQLKKFNPAIDYETWHKAQQTLDEYPQAIRKKDTVEKNALLEGLVICPNTSHRLKVGSLNGKIFYYCTARKDCKEPCTNYRLPQLELENYVLHYCQTWFQCIDKDSISKLTMKSLTNKKAKVLSEIKSLTGKRDKAWAEKLKKSDQLVLEKNESNKIEIHRKLLSINKHQLEISQQISRLRIAVSEIEQHQQRHKKILEVIVNWEEIFERMTYAEKKSLFSQILKFVYVHPADLEVVLNQKELLELA